MTASLFRAVIASVLAATAIVIACSRNKPIEVVPGAALGESTASGPSDPSVPTVDAADVGEVSSGPISALGDDPQPITTIPRPDTAPAPPASTRAPRAQLPAPPPAATMPGEPPPPSQPPAATMPGEQPPPSQPAPPIVVSPSQPPGDGGAPIVIPPGPPGTTDAGTPSDAGGRGIPDARITPDAALRDGGISSDARAVPDAPSAR